MGERTVNCWGCRVACWLMGEVRRVVVEAGLWRRGRFVCRLVGVLFLAGCGQERRARTCCCFLCSSNCNSRSKQNTQHSTESESGVNQELKNKCFTFILF